MLQIDYGQTDVALGNNLSPDQATHQPSVFFIPEEDSYYTLIMVKTFLFVIEQNPFFKYQLTLIYVFQTDPDAPSTEDKSFGPWRHWVVVNISGM